MVESWTKPRVSRHDQLLQLRYGAQRPAELHWLTSSSYELPHRVNTAKVYPVLAPNGSSVVVYGHHNGIRLLWRGGRAFKRPTASAPPEAGPAKAAKSNGVGDDVIMIIDSDDDEPSGAAPEMAADEAVEFEEEALEDPSSPYPAIVQDLDLPLGTGVVRLAFPHVDERAAPSTLSAIASQKMMMVAACADQSIRVISLPLTPPSPNSKAKGVKSSRKSVATVGRWGEQVVALGSSITLREVPNAIDLTFTGRTVSLVEDEDMEIVELEQRSVTRVRGRQRSMEGGSNEEQEWDLLIAAHSAQVSGTLLLFRAPIVAATTTTTMQREYFVAADHVTAIDVQHLASPADAVSFNPCLYPNRRHSQLLVVDGRGSVKMLECVPAPSRGSRTSSRRSSVTEAERTERPSWLISLYPGFDGSQRKRILSAVWVLGGKGVMALLSDGEWGVWDLESAGPDEGRSHRRGLHGSAKTAWSLSGWLETNRAVSTRPAAEFAPRTPHSRRREEGQLFGGTGVATSGYSRGGISVRGRVSVESSGDEAIIMWRDGALAATPSLRSFWQTQATRRRNGGSLFSADGRDRLMKLDGIDQRGEMINAVEMFACSSSDLPEVLVATEHRLLMVSMETTSPGPSGGGLFSRGSESTALVPAATESGPLQRSNGHLELDGIDQALAEMDRGSRLAAAEHADERGFTPKRRVGFMT